MSNPIRVRNLFAVATAFILSISTVSMAVASGFELVCHETSSATVELLMVSVNVIADHAAHGDASPTTFFDDFDGDGYGDPETELMCDPPDGFVWNGSDCNNLDETIGADVLCETSAPFCHP